ncbi:LuxR C-terminal-related transcriptional regulator [Kibdelosporangium philippinense]|uniref:LuxR C-terminal-related transcriptional regulator n=1 Tax=Kibdelosporangium philippinense TaxID=211113 RepID=A0ABS8ZXH1_9PSEU|nr:LuxR C-terminal-related transcriptional regulator [Kibdelosporangium philippinense]MCE7011193.1 LuxR C-terminal-related transcriptional regulator [Kibdelosporangium philippinense]
MAFPETKFQAPRLRADLVDRALVGPLVTDVLSVPLTVISAPAGYGKTTVASMVFARIGTSWMALDPDDNDPRRFLTAIATALGHEVTLDKDPDAVRRGVVALLNAIQDHTVLVLDEWEVITAPEVAGHLAYLIEWAPPALHVVVTTRHDPPIGLARLRARGQLAERGPDDLRFTAAEAAEMLGIDAVDGILARTEGWPAGLRLLAGSGRANRMPRSGDTDVFDFLADEVFNRQPEDIRRFLLETSVLTTMSAEACAALTARDDAPDVLDRLTRIGLFITEQGNAYRYHPLFAEFLGRVRLPERADLHRRAAAVETDPLAKAQHLLTAGDTAQAADILAEVGEGQLRAGRTTSIRQLLSALPVDRPELLVLQGDLAFGAGNLAEARAAYERADSPVRLADTLILQGEIAAADDLLARALAGPVDIETRVRLLLTRARAAQISGRFSVAEAAVAQGIQLAVEQSATATAAAHVSPTLLLIRGAIDHLERFVTTAQLNGLAALQVDGLAASIAMTRGRLDEAATKAADTFTAYQRFGGAPPLTGFTLAATRLMSTVPMPVDIESAIEDLRTYATQLTTASFMYPNAWFMIGRALWSRGRLDEAQAARAMMDTVDGPPTGSAPMIAMNRLSLDGLLATTRGDYRQATSTLVEAVEMEDRLEVLNIYGSTRIRLAHLYAKRRRIDEALRIARPVLAECVRTPGRILLEGEAAATVLRLIDEPFAAGLLRQLESPAPATLTEREMQVLRLMVGGATNKEIARQLVVGEETVKTHVSRVLRKMGVRTRGAATAHARSLGISPPDQG